MDLMPENRPRESAEKKPSIGAGFSLLDRIKALDEENNQLNQSNISRFEPRSASPPDPVDGSFRYTVRDLAHFGLGVLSLLAIFTVSQAFSFGALHSQVNVLARGTERSTLVAAQNIALGTKIGGQKLAEKISPLKATIAPHWEQVTGLYENTSSRFIADLAPAGRAIIQAGQLAGQRSTLAAVAGVRVVAETGRTGREFISGAATGANLMAQNLQFAGATGWQFVAGGFSLAGRSVRSSFDEANNQLIAVRRWTANNLISWHQLPPAGRGETAIVPRSIAVKLAAKAGNPPASGQASSQTALAVDTVSPPAEVREPVVLSGGLNYWYDYFFRPEALSLAVLAYDRNVWPVRLPVNRSLAFLFQVGTGAAGDIATAWDSFSGGFRGRNLSDTALREQLKNEILQELQASSSVTVKDSNATSMFDSTGIVVMKSSGSSTIDLSNVKKMQDAFSDRVIVNFDQNGQTGVIQPIFRNNKIGPKFLFVLTPVKQ